MIPSSHSSPPPKRSALLLGFAAIYLIWGSTYLCIRVAVETLPPLLMAGVRFLVAGGALFAWLRFTRGARPTARQWRDNLITGTLLLLGGNGLVCWAEQAVPSGIATLILSIAPLLIVLGDWAVAAGSGGARGSRPTGATWLGVALGFAGLALLVGPAFTADVASAGALDPRRVAGLVLACASWSAGSIYTRYAREPAEPLLGSAMQMLCGGAMLAAAGGALGEWGQFDWARVSGRSLAAWSYLVLAGSLVGFTTFVWLMKHSTPARVSTYAYVNPVVAVLLGWWLLDEPITGRTLAASAVIIGGVVIITAQKSRAAKTG